MTPCSTLCTETVTRAFPDAGHNIVMTEAVIFDMDGLLVDSEPAWHRVEVECLQRYGSEIQIAECAQTVGLRIDAVVRHWAEQKPWDLDACSIVQMERNIIEGMRKAHLNEVLVKPGAIEAIQMAKSLHVPIAIASSSSLVLIEAALKGMGVYDQFDLICSAEAEEMGKPHPAVYLTAAKKLNVNPVACTALEDSLNGVIAVKAARMRCIAVPEHEYRHNQRFHVADHILPDLLSLRKEHLLHTSL